MDDDGEFVTHRDDNLYTLEEVSFLSDNGMSLPELCKVELERDVVRWMKDAVKEM